MSEALPSQFKKDDVLTETETKPAAASNKDSKASSISLSNEKSTKLNHNDKGGNKQAVKVSSRSPSPSKRKDPLIRRDASPGSGKERKPTQASVASGKNRDRFTEHFEFFEYFGKDREQEREIEREKKSKRERVREEESERVRDKKEREQERERGKI